MLRVMEQFANRIIVRVEDGSSAELISQDLLGIVAQSGGELHKRLVQLGLQGVLQLP